MIALAFNWLYPYIHVATSSIVCRQPFWNYLGYMMDQSYVNTWVWFTIVIPNISLSNTILSNISAVDKQTSLYHTSLIVDTIIVDGSGSVDYRMLQNSYKYKSNTLFSQSFLVMPHSQFCEQRMPAALYGHFPCLWQPILYKHTFPYCKKCFS